MEQPSQGSMNRAINFVFMARVNKQVAVENMKDALIRLQGRHHAFEYGNQRNAQKESLQGDFSFPLVEFSNCVDKSWRDVAGKQMGIPFPADGPYVRINLLQLESKTDLVLTFDHQVSDGMSGILFLRDLVYLLNHPQEKLPQLPVQPPIWEIIPEKEANDWLGKLRIALFMKFADFSTWRNRNKMTEVFTPRYRIDAFELEEHASKALVDSCRREKTSVHAAISVAWMLVLQSMIYESGEQSSGLRSVSSPVSMRHLLPKDKKDCAGMYYSTVTTRMDCNHALDFWENARQIKNQMDAECKKSSFYDKPRFFKAMYERKSKLVDGETLTVPEIPVDYDFSISNLGKLEKYFDSNCENQEYQIDVVYGPIVNAFKGEKTVGVCTFRGKIRFVFTSFVGDMDEKFIQTLLEKVQAWLKLAVSSNALNTEQ